MKAPNPDYVSATAAASPNHGPRTPGAAPDHLILHYTGMESAKAALDWLRNPLSQVSSHYFIEECGRVLQLVPETRRAWHAGRSFWAGETDLNSRSIGVEIANAGHPGGLPPFPEAQIESVIALCRDICRRHGIAPRRILGHSDIAPRRKVDPGEVFPWERLHRAGVGHWVAPAPIADDVPGPPDDNIDIAPETRRLLASYGYEVDRPGDPDDTTMFAIKAFQRHFRPARVDGAADVSTLKTLRRLIETQAAPAF